MNFRTTYKEVKDKVSESFKDSALYHKIRKTGEFIRENKEILAPLTISIGSYLVTCHTGYPFPHFDKLMHYSFGYGASRLGRKIAEKTNNNEYGNLASLATGLGMGIGIELWESNPFTMSISNALSGATYKKEFGLQTIDPLDLEANLAGIITENIREYAEKAKKSILNLRKKGKI